MSVEAATATIATPDVDVTGNSGGGIVDASNGSRTGSHDDNKIPRMMTMLRVTRTLVGELKSSLQERNQHIDVLQSSLGTVSDNYHKIETELQTTKRSLLEEQQRRLKAEERIAQLQEGHQGQQQQQPQEQAESPSQTTEEASSAPEAAAAMAVDDSGKNVPAPMEAEKEEEKKDSVSEEVPVVANDGEGGHIGEDDDDDGDDADDDDDGSMSTMDLLAMELSIAKERIQILEEENQILYKQQAQLSNDLNSLEESSQMEKEEQVSNFISQKANLEDEAIYWKQIATDLQYRAEYAEQQLQQFVLVQQHQQDLLIQQQQQQQMLALQQEQEFRKQAGGNGDDEAPNTPTKPTDIIRSIFGGRKKAGGGGSSGDGNNNNNNDGESTNSRNTTTTGISSVGFGTVGKAGHVGKGLFASSLASGVSGNDDPIKNDPYNNQGVVGVGDGLLGMGDTNNMNADGNNTGNIASGGITGNTNKEAKTMIRALETRNDALEAKVAKLQSDVIRLQCSYKDESYIKQKELESLKKENKKLMQQLSSYSSLQNSKSTSTHTTMTTTSATTIGMGTTAAGNGNGGISGGRGSP